MKAFNILRNAIRPGFAREMGHKLVLRWSERNARGQREKIEAWCRAQEVDIDAWARSIDRVLWQEACDFADTQRRFADAKLGALDFDLGGGGAYHLLYFLTRLTQPAIIVETGVAAGFSSRAFLHALKRNGRGRLWSSDFPYFRLHSPEQYVGWLVEPEIRGDWQPLIEGDRQNLAKIAEQVSSIDLIHYDSDKSYEGRDFARRILAPLLSKDGILMYDDIQDNWQFRDVSRGKPFLLFAFEGKWVGLVGGPPSLHNRADRI
jgi:hypothetical protein